VVQISVYCWSFLLHKSYSLYIRIFLPDKRQIAIISYYTRNYFKPAEVQETMFGGKLSSQEFKVKLKYFVCLCISFTFTCVEALDKNLCYVTFYHEINFRGFLQFIRMKYVKPHLHTQHQLPFNPYSYSLQLTFSLIVEAKITM
jgi:hypothetical protein